LAVRPNRNYGDGTGKSDKEFAEKEKANAKVARQFVIDAEEK